VPAIKHPALLLRASAAGIGAAVLGFALAQGLGLWGFVLSSALTAPLVRFMLPLTGTRSPEDSAAPASTPPPPSRGEVQVPGLTIRVDHEDNGTVFRVTGDLDVAAAPQFRKVLAAYEHDPGPLVVDLREVSFLDSAGISELVRLHRRARERGVRVVIVRGRTTPLSQVLKTAVEGATVETWD